MIGKKGYLITNPREIVNIQDEFYVALQRYEADRNFDEVGKDELVEVWHFQSGEYYKHQYEYLYRENSLCTKYIQAYKKDTNIEYIKKDLIKKGYSNIKTNEELRLKGIEEKKGRGKDKKPRVRRTKKQIEHEENFVKINLEIEKDTYQILSLMDIEKQTDFINKTLKEALIKIKEKILTYFED